MILDADVIIRDEKGALDLKTWLSSRPEEHFEIAAITVAELWHGVERADAAHKARRREYLELFWLNSPSFLIRRKPLMSMPAFGLNGRRRAK